MKLDTIALILVGIAAALYTGAFLVGAIALTPVGAGVPALILLGVALWLLWRVVRERMANREDDYYEDNVEK